MNGDSMIALNMIIVNEPKWLVERSLSSVSKIIDEYVFLVDESYRNTSFLSNYSTNIMRDSLECRVIEEYRNKLIDSSKSDWILVLDPDEYIDVECVNSLSNRSFLEDNTDACVIPRINLERDIDGNFIVFSNYPDPQIRFFRRNVARFSGKPSDQPLLKDHTRVAFIKGHIVHDETHDMIKGKIKFCKRCGI